MTLATKKSNPNYIPGVHCGDEHCYSCATQRYDCAWLNTLDKENNNND